MGRNHENHLPHGLILVRQATRIENYFYMLTLTGSQAPVVVSATYSAHDPSKRLSRNLVIRAIERVVAKQPALGQVFVRQPSKQGKDHLWIARLPSLDVKDCVSFVDMDESEASSRRMLEHIMDQWFDLLDSSRPYWRATVVNMKTIYFSFNHIVCDGRSGVYFHRQLLTSLNDIEGGIDILPPEKYTTSSDPFPDHCENTIGRHNLLHIIWFIIKYLLQLVAELLFWPKYITFNDMKKYPMRPNIHRMAPMEERIKNKIISLRITPALMQKILTECRTQSTTFTAFLDTALNTSLCADIYPRSLFVRASTVVDIRGFCKWPYGEVMCNMAASWTKLRYAGSFSAIGKPPETRNSAENGVYTRIPAFWTMTKYRKDYMNKYLATASIQEFLGLGITPAHIDDFVSQVWGKSLSTTRNYGSLISNLGPLAPDERDKGRTWRFTDADWASSTHRSCIGPSLNITVISAPGADCVINFIYHEGSYDPTVIPRIVEVVRTRIGQVMGVTSDSLALIV
ncbi:hypothetical protein TWF730_003088 [Orbilia blumenaviensis]|uniref:Alcohol acetyltransferase n=1 Tax=Orbilia blumenaviensis TaxID=1796055 RepID=A0AAV9U8Q2_9PEZI